MGILSISRDIVNHQWRDALMNGYREQELDINWPLCSSRNRRLLCLNEFR